MKFDGNNLVLIVGAPRSGTTWLQKLLASHPLIKTGQESDVFDSYIGPQLRAWRRNISIERSGRGGVGLGCYFLEEEFIRNLKNYMDILLSPMLGSLRDNEFFLEKTPGHALFMPEIMELLPKVRIIHVLRDGRDVTASLLAVSRTWGKNWAPKKMGNAARMWQKYVSEVKRSLPLIPKPQYFELRYEQMYSCTSSVLREIANFLEIQWTDSDLLDAVDKNRPEAKIRGRETSIPLHGEIARHSGDVVIDPPGFIRKAIPGSWKTDLSLWEKINFWRVARKTLAENGYKW
jgi:hypothetical protein